jgi:hypothetical protein
MVVENCEGELMHALVSGRYRAVLALAGILAIFTEAQVVRPQSTVPVVNPAHAVNWAGLPKLPGGWSLLNGENGEASVTDGMLRIAPAVNTNLYHAPDGGFNRVNAPMVLFAPAGDFTLKAKVSAQLINIYDVGALVLYEDEGHWAKLCFENSVRQEATIVSVVTRERSDDTNSETVASPFVYMAIARKDNQITLHFSRDGQQWRLVRAFQMTFGPGLRVGFAAHTNDNSHFAATFSEITYHASAPKNMWDLVPADVAER